MPTARVKWFNDAKGYGFLETPDGDVFVHYSVIQMDKFRYLREGEVVLYEAHVTPKGLQALTVLPDRTEETS